MLHPKRMPLLPPPYSGSPSNCSRAPSPFVMDSRSRSLPPPPEPWVDLIVEPVPASRFQFPSRVTASPPPFSSSRSYTTGSSSSHTYSHPLPPLPPPPLPINITASFPTSRSRSGSVAKSRSAFPFSASKLSKATRSATAWFTEHAARKGSAETMFELEKRKRSATESEATTKATRIGTEEELWKTALQTKAIEAVKSNMQSLLSCDLPNEEWDAVLQKCGQICANGGVDLSVVLQEPLVDGNPPVYWAILNGSTTSSQSNDAALHALVLSLLDTCQPLKETTISSLRRACMLTSNNALLQHLFWHFPALSPLTRSDAMLLSSVGGGDVVDVVETRDGTGTFVARIQIRRFRLRMRVSKLVKVEFVTSDRIWTVTFSIGAKNTTLGRSESNWLLSIGLGNHSAPAWVDGDFLVLRRLPSIDRRDDYEPTFSLPLGQNPCKLHPGPESAIKMNLEEGPMRPHLLNESMALVDRDGTLHAQFDVRLTQPPLPPIPPPSIDISDGASVRSSAQKSTRSKPTRSLLSNNYKDKRKQDGPEKEPKVYTSLRRGGR